MTIDEFVERLSKTGLRWRNDKRLRSGTWDLPHCPISAVTGDPDDFREPKRAGKGLGLSAEDTLAIVRAADTPSLADPDLYLRLRQACGLE